MAIVYLEPGDVPAADARRVLEALNAATSPRELDVAIEFPDEPDIGVRLGRRLLDRRDELGGFRDLRQVRAVPLIGPERFTEIVVALSGRTVFELLGVSGVSGALTPRPAASVDLDVHERGPYLGQLTTIVVTVTVDRRRRPGHEVLLTAATGRLRAVTAGRVVEGAAITLVSGQDGKARATWSPATDPPLPSAVTAALADALGELPSAAETPADAVEGLRRLVAAYRWEPNAELRRAVDLLTRTGTTGGDDVDLAGPWPRHHVTVTASLLAVGSDVGLTVRPSASGSRTTPVAAAAPLATGGAVQAVAVRSSAPRDWRPAMVHVHGQVVRETTPLRTQLDTDTREARDPGDLLGRVQRRVGDFLGVQLGQLGVDVARTVAVEASEGFVLERTADLPLDARMQVTPVIVAMAGTVGSSSPAVVRALTETRSTVLQRLDERVATELPPLQDRVVTLADAVTAKVDLSDFDRVVGAKLDRVELEQRLTGLVDRGTLEEALGDRVDRATFDEALADRVDRGTFEEAVADRVDFGTLEEVLARFVDRRVLDAALSAHVALEEFRAFVERTSARLDRLEERG